MRLVVEEPAKGRFYRKSFVITEVSPEDLPPLSKDMVEFLESTKAEPPLERELAGVNQGRTGLRDRIGSSVAEEQRDVPSAAARLQALGDRARRTDFGAGVVTAIAVGLISTLLTDLVAGVGGQLAANLVADHYSRDIARHAVGIISIGTELVGGFLFMLILGHIGRRIARRADYGAASVPDFVAGLIAGLVAILAVTIGSGLLRDFVSGLVFLLGVVLGALIVAAGRADFVGSRAAISVTGLVGVLGVIGLISNYLHFVDVFVTFTRYSVADVVTDLGGLVVVVLCALLGVALSRGLEGKADDSNDPLPRTVPPTPSSPTAAS
jgi:hypothetical protein